MNDNSQRIVRIDIANPGVVRYHPDVERELQVAVYDLVEDNVFQPRAEHFGSEPVGPYALTLSIAENRLEFLIHSENGESVGSIKIPLVSFRKVIKDYFTVCESYYEAIRSASPSMIEAIDMGRRGLHNEGSERLRGQLSDRVEVDHDTARRLFTLICALHIRA